MALIGLLAVATALQMWAANVLLNLAGVLRIHLFLMYGRPASAEDAAIPFMGDQETFMKNPLCVTKIPTGRESVPAAIPVVYLPAVGL